MHAHIQYELIIIYEHIHLFFAPFEFVQSQFVELSCDNVTKYKCF